MAARPVARRAWRVVAAFFLVLVLAAGCGPGKVTSLEERAQSLDRSLICPVCPGETIDQSQVELARQMRGIVREKLAEGWTRDQVLQFFVDRYGERVLAAPPKEGFNLLAWLVPIVALVTSVAALLLVVRAMRRSESTAPEGGRPSDEGLERYLQIVDQELDLDPGNSREAPGDAEPEVERRNG